MHEICTQVFASTPREALRCPVTSVELPVANMTLFRVLSSFHSFPVLFRRVSQFLSRLLGCMASARGFQKFLEMLFRSSSHQHRHPSPFHSCILCAPPHLGDQARKNNPPEKRRHSQEHGGDAAAASGGTGAASALSEDPALAYLHAVVAVVIGSLLSSDEGSLASETLAVGVRAHVSQLFRILCNTSRALLSENEYSSVRLAVLVSSFARAERTLWVVAVVSTPCCLAGILLHYFEDRVEQAM